MKVRLKLLVSVLAVFALVSVAVMATTITFWKFTDTYGDPLIVKYINEWNQLHPNTKVDFVEIPWAQYTTTKLSAAFASGQGPDIFWVSPGDELRYYNAGVLESFDKYLTPEQINDFFPVAKDKVTIDGKIYGLPIELEPLAIYYNKDLFDQYHLSIPQDWHELLEDAKILTTKDRWGLILDPTPTYYELFTFYPFLWSAGGSVVNKDWTKSTFDSTSAIAALTFYQDAFNKYKVSPKSIPTAGTNDISTFVSGFGAMQECGEWAIQQLTVNPPKFKWGYFPIPPMTKGGTSVSVMGGWIQVVNKNSPVVKQAIDFTLWLFFKTDFLKQWCTVQNSKLPAYKSIYESAKDYYSQPIWKTFIDEILPTAKPEPRYTPEMDLALENALQSVIFANVSPAIAAKTAAQQIDNFLSTYTGAH